MKDAVCVKQDCTLCMACVNSCPREAISLGWDENGYEKITIDENKCVNCGICEKICLNRGTMKRHSPLSSYAAQAKDNEALGRSASGGAFQMLAETVLEQGGICYGCEMVLTENGFFARHVRIDDQSQLPRILNSKYIPSIIGKTYREVKADLEAERLVLFSGTPCQIEGLRAYLAKEYENLITADLICHGVTSARLFNDYIHQVEERDQIRIVEYMFRDKQISWGTNYCYRYYRKTDPKRFMRCRHCPREESSYMMHYLRGDFFREACYTCTLSSTDRVSDFTLGDYWAIEKEHPEFITDGRPRMVLRRGISCILANTEKAEQNMKLLDNKMIIHQVPLQSIVLHNGNLQKASEKGKMRDEILSVYRNHGYKPIDERYRQSVGYKMGIYRAKNFLKSYLPDWLRIFIYRSPMLSRLVFH